MSAPAHLNEEQRLEALHRLGILDTETEERFDRITRLLSTVLDCPIALVSLVDRHRQWFKSKVGLEAEQTTREVAFCAHAIVAPGDGPFVVNDARLDTRFSDNPLVTGDPSIRFYAGQVLRDRDGHSLGTLCAIDRQPRKLEEAQLQVLADLAALAEQELNRIDELALLMQLDASERRKDLILNTLTEALVYQDSSGTILNWNPAAEAVLGLSADELAGRCSIDPRWGAIHEDGSEWPGDTHPAMMALKTGEPVNNLVMGIMRPGRGRAWLRVNAQPVRDATGNTTFVLTAFADITTEHELAVERRRFSYLFRYANDVITVMDESGNVSYSSPSAGRVLGYEQTAGPSENVFARLHPDDRTAADQFLTAVKGMGRVDDPVVLRVRQRSGDCRYLECVGVNLLDDPTVQGLVITSRDITERHHQAEELAHSASHDALTDLPNRRRLAAKITTALDLANSEQRQIGLCFIDLDGFKGVNDRYGHAVGDSLLVAVGNAIRQMARPGDLVARMGGDEFVVVLDPVADAAEAHSLATELRKAIRGQSVVGVPDTSFDVSVGVAVSRGDDTHSSLLQRADAALYNAKALRGSVELAEAILAMPG